jgi:glycosyltransferase involved in cell wall biosynthesis
MNTDTNKKIIRIISAYALSSEATVNNRISQIIKQLLDNGFEVVLLSPDNFLDHLQHPNFKIDSTVSFRKKHKNFVIRAIYEITLVLRLLFIANRKKVDLNIVTLPSMFFVFFLFIIGSQKIYIDIRDLTWEYIFSEKAKFIRVLRNFINWNFQFCDKILVTNASEKELIERYYVFDKPIYILTNGITYEKARILGAVKNRDTCTPCISYIGNIGQAQNVDVLLRCAQKLPNIQFRIIGDGIHYENLQSAQKNQDLKNVELTGRLEWHDLIHEYQLADVLFLQLRPEYKTAVPSKLYEYLCTGKSIIFSGNGYVANFIKNFENCHIVEYGDDSALITKIEEICDSNLHKIISFANRDKILRDYTREAATAKLVEWICIDTNHQI